MVRCVILDRRCAFHRGTQEVTKWTDFVASSSTALCHRCASSPVNASFMLLGVAGRFDCCDSAVRKAPMLGTGCSSRILALPALVRLFTGRVSFSCGDFSGMMLPAIKATSSNRSGTAVAFCSSKVVTYFPARWSELFVVPSLFLGCTDSGSVRC